MEKSTYDKSNAIVKVRLKSFVKKYSHDVLCSGDSVEARELHGQALIDYLCKKFRIDNAYLSVTTSCRPCRRSNAQAYGMYYPATRRITIYNTTAKTRKTVSIKSFYDTLLHEFMHHYDLLSIKIGGTPHTAGFYKRISDLREKLSE